MPPLPCDPSTRPPTCRAPNPPRSQCRIVAKHQETECFVVVNRIAGAVLDAHLAENEAYRRAIDEKVAEAAAFRAATESLKKVNGHPSAKNPPN